MGGNRSGVGPVARAGLLVTMLVAMLPGPSGRAQPGPASPAAADLSVEVLSQLEPVPPGTVIAHEAVIRNRGTAVADTTTVHLEIPAASVSVESGPECAVVGSAQAGPIGPIDLGPWSVRCDLGTLAPGSEIRLVVMVTSASPGTHVALARVSSGGADANPFDNSAETPVLVLPDTAGFTPAFQQPGPLNPLGRSRA